MFLNDLLLLLSSSYIKYAQVKDKIKGNPQLFTVLATFLSLDHVRILAVYGRVRELSEFMKNILNCVPKMNEGLTGLE